MVAMSTKKWRELLGAEIVGFAGSGGGRGKRRSGKSGGQGLFGGSSAEPTSLVNRPMRTSEQEATRQSVKRGRPYGDPGWQARTAAGLGLEHTFRNRGRPRKEKQ